MKAGRIYHLLVEDLPLTVLGARKDRLAEGSVIGVTVPPGSVHLFGAEDGRRIEAMVPVSRHGLVTA